MPSRGHFASGDRGSAAVRAWVDLYTSGLPRAMRDRRREEVAADLADETLDAVAAGSIEDLAARRYARLVRGIPADLAWRMVAARGDPPSEQEGRPALPASRLSLVLLGFVGILAAIGIVLALRTLAMLETEPEPWLSWGPYGFLVGTATVLVGVLVSVPRPKAGAFLALAGALIGALASPWLLMFWLWVPIAVATRLAMTAAPARPRSAG